MCQQHWHCVTALYSGRGNSLADVLFHFSARIQMLTQRTRANNISANKNSRKMCVYMHTDPIWSCSSGKSFQKVFLVSLVYRSDVRNTYTHSMFHRSTMNVLVRVHVCVCVQFVLLCLIMATIFHRLYSKTSTFSIEISIRAIGADAIKCHYLSCHSDIETIVLNYLNVRCWLCFLFFSVHLMNAEFDFEMAFMEIKFSAVYRNENITSLWGECLPSIVCIDGRYRRQIMWIKTRQLRKFFQTSVLLSLVLLAFFFNRLLSITCASFN